MSATPEQRQRVMHFHAAISGWLKPAVTSLADDADAVLEEGGRVFAAMLDELPYVDRPEHTMSSSMFACAAMLAVYEVLRARGVDAHVWGAAIHALPPAAADAGDAELELGRATADAVASLKSAAPNEFVFEMIEGDGETDYGMNVESCAICNLFGRHDAMDLAPYMCALDDVVSDAKGQGLRRTGTIALGATRCDFRFESGGDPLRLVDQYPDRIRLN